MEFLKQIGTAGEKPRVHHGSLHRRVCLGQLDALSDRPHTVSDLESTVPERVKYGAHEGLRGVLRTGTKEKHEIDIRMGSQFATSIPAQRHDTTLAKTGVG